MVLSLSILFLRTIKLTTMRQILILLFSSWLPMSLFAQKISGVIKDESNQPVNGSTVSLLRLKDSVSVKYTATKETGKFQIDNISRGDYIISATHVGYKPVYSASISIDNGDVVVPDLTVNKISGNLKVLR